MHSLKNSNTGGLPVKFHKHLENKFYDTLQTKLLSERYFTVSIRGARVVYLRNHHHRR